MITTTSQVKDLEYHFFHCITIRGNEYELANIAATTEYIVLRDGSGDYYEYTVFPNQGIVEEYTLREEDEESDEPTQINSDTEEVVEEENDLEGVPKKKGFLDSVFGSDDK